MKWLKKILRKIKFAIPVLFGVAKKINNIYELLEEQREMILKVAKTDDGSAILVKHDAIVGRVKEVIADLKSL